MRAAPPAFWSVVTGALAAAAVSSCGQRPPAARTDGTEAEAARVGYVAPPRVERVAAGAGSLVLEGSAPAGARIRVTETGGAYGGTAEAGGRWRVEAPAAAVPRLFTVSAESGQRLLEGEGRLLVLPDRRAFLLRSGYGALPVGAASNRLPAITSVDVGADGAAAVSGLAEPSVPVVTRIDGQAPARGASVGSGAADRNGRFSIILARPLGPGAHLIEVNTPRGAARVRLSVAPAPAADQTFASSQEGGAWRVVWRAPSGGVQTTYVLPLAAAS